MHIEFLGQTPFTFKKVDSDELLRETFKLRYAVYCRECNFISEEDYPYETESDEFDKFSQHFVAMDPYGVIGSSRLILHSHLDFPIEQHCLDLLVKDATFDRKKTAEVSRLVISKQYRRRKDDGLYYGPNIVDPPDEKPKHNGEKRIRPMAFGIYREMYQESKKRGITHWYALMETKLWRLLNMHGFTFVEIGEEIDFYGPVKPYIVNIAALEKELASRSSKFFAYFTEGLEPQYLPSLAASGDISISEQKSDIEKNLPEFPSK